MEWRLIKYVRPTKDYVWITTKHGKFSDLADNLNRMQVVKEYTDSFEIKLSEKLNALVSDKFFEVFEALYIPQSVLVRHNFSNPKYKFVGKSTSHKIMYAKFRQNLKNAKNLRATKAKR